MTTEDEIGHSENWWSPNSQAYTPTSCLVHSPVPRAAQVRVATKDDMNANLAYSAVGQP